MLMQLATPATSDGAVGLLLECHERIRSFLALARRLADADVADQDAVQDAALRVRRYFIEALPLHARDEQESILPRLRARGALADADLELMAKEHRDHERPLATLVAACEEIARVPRRLPELQRIVARAAAELARHFEEHLAREETVIFPAIRRFLDPATDAAIVREILARRALAGRFAHMLTQELPVSGSPRCGRPSR